MTSPANNCVKFSKQMRNLIDIIHFAENVSTKIHGASKESEIYRIVGEEFAKSQYYSASILLLTEDRSQLRLIQTSLNSEQKCRAEKITGHLIEDFRINLDRSPIYNQVVTTGQTVHIRTCDILAEFFPLPVAKEIIKAIGLENKSSLLTPLVCQGQIIGIFAVSSPEPTDYFISSVKSLAQHISTALEREEAHVAYRNVSEALRINEARYCSLCDDVLNSTEVGLFILDSGFRVVWMNRTMELYTGMTRDEVLGTDKRRLVHEKIKHLFKDPEGYARRVIAAYDNNDHLGSLECCVRPGPGRIERWLEYKSRPIKSGLYAGGRIELYYDITSRKNLELQIIRQEKLATVGRVTTGVAHEINNPLDILLSQIEFILMDCTNLNGITKCLKEMKDQVLRISHITHSLLSHSRDTFFNFEPLDINSLLQNILFMFRNLKLDNRLFIETHLSPGLSPIMGDPFELEKVFVNIVTNAIDAIPQKGKITITTHMINEDLVQVEISDSGIGIPEEHLDKIFEPFFTTKAPSKGTGLGLFLSRKIITRHQGIIEVKSRVGKGTTIIITLPSEKNFRRMKCNQGRGTVSR